MWPSSSGATGASGQSIHCPSTRNWCGWCPACAQPNPSPACQLPLALAKGQRPGLACAAAAEGSGLVAGADSRCREVRASCAGAPAGCRPPQRRPSAGCWSGGTSSWAQPARVSPALAALPQTGPCAQPCSSQHRWRWAVGGLTDQPAKAPVTNTWRARLLAGQVKVAVLATSLWLFSAPCGWHRLQGAAWPAAAALPAAPRRLQQGCVSQACTAPCRPDSAHAAAGPAGAVGDATGRPHVAVLHGGLHWGHLPRAVHLELVLQGHAGQCMVWLSGQPALRCSRILGRQALAWHRPRQLVLPFQVSDAKPAWRGWCRDRTWCRPGGSGTQT